MALLSRSTRLRSANYPATLQRARQRRTSPSRRLRRVIVGDCLAPLHVDVSLALPTRVMSDTVKVAPRRFGGSSATPCGGCDRPVYHAESVMGPAGRTYHRVRALKRPFVLRSQACLRCSSCNKTLDAVRLLEHDGDPYCKPCHTSSFGIEVRWRSVAAADCGRAT